MLSAFSSPHTYYFCQSFWLDLAPTVRPASSLSGLPCLFRPNDSLTRARKCATDGAKRRYPVGYVVTSLLMPKTS